MNPINPWLDPTEVRRLAEQLMCPTHQPTMTATDAGFDSAFIGYAAHDEVPPTTSSPVHETTSEPLQNRFTRFCHWLHQQFSATDVFILDHVGTVIFDESGHKRLHFIARSVALTPRRSSSTGGNVYVKIGVSATLEIIPVKTGNSEWVLGAALPDSLNPASRILIMEALVQVASAPEGS